jgi:uncharacterized protein
MRPRPATSGLAIRALLTLLVLLLGTVGSAPAAELKFPPLTGRVVDDAGILNAATTGQLDEMLAQHERTSGEQVVVATVGSLQGHSIEDYGYQLGRAWGIGQKGKNTGAILLVAPTERKVRIEVGYGLEGQLTDAISHVIIENQITPQFRSGDFNGGVLAGTGAILRALGDDAAANLHPELEQVPQASDYSTQLSPTTFVMLIFFLIVIFLLMRRSRYPYLMRRGGGPYSGSGGFFGGGSSGGGGFSGGGGSFGGGGASGGW